MMGTISRRWWLGLLGLLWLGGTGPGQAWQRPPLKVDTVFQFRIDVKVGPEIQRPSAPWYVYFPADPRMLPSPQTSPYPPWPGQFPPQGPPADAAHDAMQKQQRGMNFQPGPMLTQYGPGYQTYGSNLQPVAYVPVQAPSYWYRDR